MDNTDITIRKQLQNWAKGQTPPASLKARLLKSAAAPRLSFYKTKPIKLPTLPVELVSWAWVYSFDRSIISSQLIR
jgi:hypothetical protein